ncbi:transposase [Caballeronia sp. EK]|uniref:transposase n=1 Tax=Caballeronia sp. EK TaxID=2767469 RepID=UPI0021026626|nr:transposase [Caballeronia sp. EK]
MLCRITQLTLAILGELFDPRKVVAMRRDVLARFLSRHASGNHPKSGPFIDSLVEKLKSAAEETIERHGDSVEFVALQFEVAQEVEHQRLWDRHVSATEREVEQIYQRVHPSNALRSITGIGATLAPLLIKVLGYAKRFRNEDHIRGFCGMFPRITFLKRGLHAPAQTIDKR